MAKYDGSDAALAFATGGLTLLGGGGFAKKLFGGRKKPDDFAARTNAEIARRNYDSYVANYRPLEEYMFSQLGNWDALTEQASTQAYQDALDSGKMSQDVWERRMEGFGLQVTPGQRKAAQRRFDIDAAKTAINSANQTTRRMDELQYNTMGGFNPRGQMLGNR